MLKVDGGVQMVELGLVEFFSHLKASYKGAIDRKATELTT